MGDFLNMVAIVAAGLAVSVGFGIWVGAGFLQSRWAQAVKAHPRTTRWTCLLACVALIAFFSFVFIKLARPIYWAYIAAVSLVIIAGSCLSWIEQRILWKEFFTLAFWFTTKEEHPLAKNGM